MSQEPIEMKNLYHGLLITGNEPDDDDPYMVAAEVEYVDEDEM